VGRLHPNHRFRKVSEITPEFLKEEGLTGVLVDIDNTIVPWRGEVPSPEVKDWFKSLKEAGVSVALLSNAGGPRGRRMAEALGVPVVAPAKKPFRTGYQRGLAALRLTNEQVAAVGDQIFMDVLGGSRSGICTILVEPVSRQEFVMTKLLRQVEKLVRQPL
jgi:HAD superfamily phosphatase (TIGR01668 family)